MLVYGIFTVAIKSPKTIFSKLRFRHHLQGITEFAGMCQSETAYPNTYPHLFRTNGLILKFCSQSFYSVVFRNKNYIADFNCTNAYSVSIHYFIFFQKNLSHILPEKFPYVLQKILKNDKRRKTPAPMRFP